MMGVGSSSWTDMLRTLMTCWTSRVCHSNPACCGIHIEIALALLLYLYSSPFPPIMASSYRHHTFFFCCERLSPHHCHFRSSPHLNLSTECPDRRTWLMFSQGATTINSVYNFLIFIKILSLRLLLSYTHQRDLLYLPRPGAAFHLDDDQPTNQNK
jgi:hypothetical protein